MAYIQTRDILPTKKQEEAKQKSSFDFFWQKAGALDFSRLEKGELIVHRKHGVGQIFRASKSFYKGPFSRLFCIGL